MIWKQNAFFPAASEVTSPSPGVQGSGDGWGSGQGSIHAFNRGGFPTQGRMQTSKCYVWLDKIFHPLEFGIQVKAAPLSLPSVSYIMKKCFNLKLLQHYHMDKIGHYNSPNSPGILSTQIYLFRARRLKPIWFVKLFFFLNRHSTKNSDNTINVPTNWAQLNSIKKENISSRSTSTIRNRKKKNKSVFTYSYRHTTLRCTLN